MIDQGENTMWKNICITFALSVCSITPLFAGNGTIQSFEFGPLGTPRAPARS